MIKFNLESFQFKLPGHQCVSSAVSFPNCTFGNTAVATFERLVYASTSVRD